MARCPWQGLALWAATHAIWREIASDLRSWRKERRVAEQLQRNKFSLTLAETREEKLAENGLVACEGVRLSQQFLRQPDSVWARSSE